MTPVDQLGPPRLEASLDVAARLRAWRRTAVRDLLRILAFTGLILAAAYLPFAGDVRPYVFVLTGGFGAVLWVGSRFERIPFAVQGWLLVSPMLVSAVVIALARGVHPIAAACAAVAGVLAALAYGRIVGLAVTAVAAVAFVVTAIAGPFGVPPSVSPRSLAILQALGTVPLVVLCVYSVGLVLRRLEGVTRDSVALVERLRREAAERDQLVAAMQESEERFRLAFKTSPDAFSLSRVDDSTWLAVNDGFTRMYGWTEDEVVGRRALEMGLWVDPADRQRVGAILHAEGELRDVETRHRRKDGEVRTVVMSGSKFMARDGTVQVLTVIRDVTDERRLEVERKRLREQFAQAQKIEAVGRLAGGVAHEFNNLLTSFGASAGYIGMEAPKDSELSAIAAELETGVERGTQLTRQLLAFTQRQVLQPRPVDVNALLGDLRRVLERVLGVNVQVVLEPSKAPARVLGDPGQLQQVLLNLVVNARDAMTKGGRIVLATSVRPGADTSLGEVVLEVTDEGPGIPPEVMEHLFEPFFSTKADGTGLGLASVYGIVKQHRGTVEVDPGVGRGATFRIRLPAVRDVDPAEVATPGLPPRGQGQHVLLVDDEAVVRRATERLLQRLGYHVTVASSGAEALEVLRSGARVDLLVTDVAMPGMSGRELAQSALEQRPGTPVLFVSGYAEDVISNELLAGGGKLGFMPKPYSLEALAEKVRELLAG